MKELYPKIGMRQMSDNDILFDAEKRSEVSDFMKKSGYYHKNAFNTHCDEWVKEPMYNYEMHMKFFSEGFNPLFYNYYKDVFKKLIRINDKTYEYKFTDKDEKKSRQRLYNLKRWITIPLRNNRFIKKLSVKYYDKQKDGCISKYKIQQLKIN